MAQTQVTYTDKVANAAPPEGKWRAADANELKTAINDNAVDTQSQLDLKADLVGGLVPASQLPSYVDDVLEYADFISLPGTGEAGKIYITINDSKTYRWSGSAYVEISSETLLNGGTITGTLTVDGETNLRPALDKGNALNLFSEDGIRSCWVKAPLNGETDAPFEFNTFNSFDFQVDTKSALFIDYVKHVHFNYGNNSHSLSIHKNTAGTAFNYDAPTDVIAINSDIDVTGNGLKLGTGARVSVIRDQDDMVGNSPTALATQQSIKAYVDNTAGAYLPLTGGTLTGTLTLEGAVVAETLNTGDNILTTDTSGQLQESGAKVETAPTGGSGFTFVPYTTDPTAPPNGFLWVQEVDANTKKIVFSDGTDTFSVQLGKD